MKVLFLLNYAGKGGTEKYVRVMAEKLLAAGDSCLFCYHETGPLKEDMENLGIASFKVAMKGPFDMKAAKALAKICRENKVDIVHTQFARENYIAIHGANFFQSGAKVIHTAHINLENNALQQLANKIFMHKNSAVIAVCKSVQAHLIQNQYPRDKITVIPNGIALDGGEGEMEADSSAARRELGIPDGMFVFVTLTRFSPEKGVQFLLSSTERLKRMCSVPFQVLIAGDGELYRQAKDFVEEKGLSETVIMPGYRTDPAHILSCGDVFVNSSRSEASSFAIFEAMAKSLPVIATDVGGNPDIVNEETGCGILTPYGDIEAMAKCMARFLTDGEFRENCGRNARKAVETTFHIETTFNSLYGLYKKALEV